MVARTVDCGLFCFGRQGVSFRHAVYTLLSTEEELTSALWCELDEERSEAFWRIRFSGRRVANEMEFGETEGVCGD